MTSLFLSLALAILPFELPWMNHPSGPATYRTSDHRDGVFVVEAYFLGCHYCHVNAPNVHELAGKYASEKRVQVLDVGIDRSDSQYQTWIQQHKPNHPVLKDAQRQVVRKLGVGGYPSTYVIDCKGNVTYETSGVWNSETRQAIQSAVDEALKVTCS